MMGHIDKIFHISDIHCRLYQRHNEYREVFSRLFDEISATCTDDSLIVITGDVVHGKTDMSPELVSLVSFFLKGCADLCPTLVIPGNHDLNLSNLSRLDAISPIADALDHPQLTYFTGDGVYQIGQIDFHHFSVLSDKSGWDDLMKVNRVPGRTYIGLYHGAVAGATTDIGFSDFQDAVPVNLFSQFDFTLLGDIHKTQFLGTKKNIAYPGSLIQQDHGELPDRGMLVWDVDMKTAEFKRIHNDYGYATIYVNGGIMNAPDILPEKARVRVIHSGTDEDVLKQLIDEVSVSNTFQELRMESIDTAPGTDRVVELDDVINSRKPEVQMKLYREFLSDEHVPPHIWEEIDRINNDLNNRVRSLDATPLGVQWKPIRFTFSNMFSYGENNVIDFDDISGIVGLFAPNASGKSALLDAIVYCIFDKCSRTTKAAHVMNNRSDEFSCQLEFMIGSDRFFITRLGSKNSKGAVSVKTDFSRQLPDGTIEMLNGQRRDDTNKIIRDYVGTYDDFILTTLSSQNDNRSFIDMTKKDRQELLYRFLDIYVFVDLFNLAKEESRSIATEIKLLSSENYEQRITDLLSEERQVKADYADMEQKLSDAEGVVTEHTGIIEKLIATKKPVDPTLDIQSLEVKQKYTENRIAEETATAADATVKLQNKQGELNEYLKLVDGADVTPIRNRQVELLKRRNEFNSIRNDMRVLGHDRMRLQGDIEALATHEYDPNCKYCVQNPFVLKAKGAEATVTDIDAKLQVLEAQLSDEKSVEAELADCESKIVVFNNVMATKAKLESEVSQLESQLRESNLSVDFESANLKAVHEKIAQYYQQEKNIEQNREIDELIRLSRVDREASEQTVRGIQGSLRIMTGTLSTITNQLEGVRTRLAKYNETVTKFKAYEYYMSATNRDGVPYMILKKILPIIQTEVNGVLSGMVDFTFELEIGDGDSIDGYVHYQDDSWAIELVSGMERFILSLAIRSSLINLSELPKPNFLVIDEGFGVLDSDKLNSIYVLFQYLKTQFEFVLCITHISGMKDYVDSQINIDKSTGYSRIAVT